MITQNQCSEVQNEVKVILLFILSVLKIQWTD
jgi:hypothetical protein